MAEHEAGSPSPSVPNSVQVIETIADHIGEEPNEVDFTFADYLDPDALDALLESPANELVVAFTIEDMLVTVSNDGTIEVKDYQD